MDTKLSDTGEIIRENDTFKVNKIIAEVGDTVTWISEITDFKIWFPPGRDPLSIRESPRIRKGQPFRRTVPRSATESFENNQFNPEGESNEERYQYSIFCYENDTMAVGNSSAEIIIRR